MALLNDILIWSTGLVGWQRDALRRLFVKDCLEPQDYDDLYALLKTANGIADAQKRGPQPLDKTHLPTTTANSAPVILKAIRDLKFVNRIAPNQKLEFSATGMTIIYGGNGTGKSGYARVLKRACRSRDHTETVLPDAFDVQAFSKTPEAMFDVEIGGKLVPLTWTHSKTSPDELATVAVFDGKCARAYLDSEQDVAFVPYGLDIVENLAQVVIKELLRRVDADIACLDTDTGPYADLLGDTVVGRMIQSLSATTDAGQIAKLANLTAEELDRLGALDKALAENDPLAKAKALRLACQRIEALVTRCDAAIAVVSDQRVEQLKAKDAEAQAAARAETVAATQFRSGEELLPGTGEQTWKLLFDSARRFSEEVAYVGKPFPNTESKAKCVFCQQELDADASARLKRFQEYLKADIAKVASQSRKTILLEKQQFSAANVALGFDDPLVEEIGALNAAMPEAIRGLEKLLALRKTWVLQALEGHSWENPPAVDIVPRVELQTLSGNLAEQASALENAADQAKKVGLEKERAELRARASLAAKAKPLTELHQRMVLKAKLVKCKDGLKTTAISNKAKEFSNQAVTSALMSALDKEFKALGVGHIKTELKSRVVQGKMKHKIVLDLPIAKRAELNQILSEGEQRAIAIGSFLAELQLSGHQAAIVFDDPVSSLDHHRRKDVVRRLVAEAAGRQVVILTHDSSFLGELLDELEKAKSEALIHHLEWHEGRPGAVRFGLPWEHQTYKERIDGLEKTQRALAKTWPPYPTAQDNEAMRRVYSHLRATIERVIQDVIFNGVVKRYRDWIRVDSLEDVVGFAANEYGVIARLHKACCQVVDAHDPASAKNAAPPSPTELAQDIADLKQVVDDIKARRKAAKATTSAVTP